MRGCGGAPIPLDCWPPVGTSWTRIGAMLELLFAIVKVASHQDALDALP